MRSVGDVLYLYLQDVQSVLAPGIAAAFLIGILWILRVGIAADKICHRVAVLVDLHSRADAHHFVPTRWMILILGWVFVPFYSRSMVYTMPEFLEKRFNPQSRTILAAMTIQSSNCMCFWLFKVIRFYFSTAKKYDVFDS